MWLTIQGVAMEIGDDPIAGALFNHSECEERGAEREREREREREGERERELGNYGEARFKNLSMPV